MVVDKNKIQEIVSDIVQNNTENLGLGLIDENTLLLTEGSLIDSLTLVSIIVDIETVLSENFNKDISLSDDNAMQRKISPYKNIKTLVDYIIELMNQ